MRAHRCRSWRSCGRAWEAAASKYAGKGGRVEAIDSALDVRRLFYVRTDGNRLETAFEERGSPCIVSEIWEDR